MRRASIYLIIFLFSGLWLGSTEANGGRGGGGISRGGGNVHPQVQNRSAGNFNSANINSANINRTNVNRNNFNTANVNRNVANVNRNVTNVNRNVNVNRDVDVHGGYWNGGYWDDHDWGWGSFAAGAAVGATTAAVGAAAADHHDTVVVTPPAGTVIATLPSSCAMVGTSGTAVYNCSGIYYRPYYSGSSLVYQVVQYP